MVEQELDPNLRDSMLRWLTQVYADLNKDFSKVIMSLGVDRWYALPTGELQKFPNTILLNPQKVDELIFQGNGIWPEVERHALTSPAVMRHTSSMIGSTHGMRRVYSLQEVFRLILPTPEIISATDVYLNLEEDLEVIIDRFLAELLKSDITTSIVWPITGLSTDTPLELEEQLSFQALSTAEKLSCLNFGMIASANESVLSAQESRWYGLVLKSSTPKFNTNGDLFDPSEILRFFQFQQDALEDFLVCSCLVMEATVNHGGGHSHAPSIELGGKFVGVVTGRGIPNGDLRFRFVDSWHKITDDEGQQLIEVWKLLRGKSTQKGYRQIINAARRLYYSSIRHKPGDILIDLMISAESLYLDGEDKGELSYRLSLNSSLWGSEDPARQKELFQLFRKAYSLRSRIVHGASFPEATVAEVCNEIRPIIKCAINKAFGFMMRGEKLPKWESLLFPNT